MPTKQPSPEEQERPCKRRMTSEYQEQIETEKNSAQSGRAQDRRARFAASCRKFSTKIERKLIKKTSTRATLPAAPQMSNSRLLGLPAELRQNIWEIVILQNDHIAVDSTYKPPALLAVNRQIRHETKSAWLYRNTFSFHIVDCSSALLHKFIREQMVGSNHNVPINITTGIINRGVRHWKNLMTWCETVFKEEYGVTMGFEDHQQGKELHEMDVTMSNATKVASELQKAGVEWEVCRNVLERMRQVAATYEPDWLVEHE